MKEEKEERERIARAVTKRDIKYKDYDDTIMPPDVENAGRASYVKRNQAMINASEYCIFYYNLDCHAKHQTKSGTRIAFELADQKRKKGKDIQIINLYEDASIQ